MFIGAWLVVALAGACGGERWRWDEDGAGAASVRIDTKVRFVDDSASRHRQNNVQADEIKEPTDTGGFYNRPAGSGSGRYPVRAEPQRMRDGAYTRYQSDGTLDSLQYCKCVSTAECTPRTDLPQACASGMFLCCYKRPSKNRNSEYFNEIDDERPMLLPNYEKKGGAFPDAPGVEFGENSPRLLAARPVLTGPEGPTGHIGPHGPIGDTGSNQRNPGLLVGPEGPTGHIGPHHRDDRAHAGQDRPNSALKAIHRNTGVLVGPDGPTGHIGPAHSSNKGVLAGPDGPTGQIGPEESAQRGVLVGNGGPTGYLGPQQFGQQPVLVGPGGPTGMIGPGGRGGRRQSVLVGPGGPTGMIGPYGFQGGRMAQPGLLIGPGGPTGIIGPGRRLLVGPGGPTGQIGPRGYGQFGF
ncbi:uncharacterized protein [Choristoneura fumiferana]|uniref:uncharacterized protein n=1 Tax=Choristoneura fumiferana TaxID=7141 RepID=UPI003D15C66D